MKVILSSATSTSQTTIARHDQSSELLKVPTIIALAKCIHGTRVFDASSLGLRPR
jgi:hypothetical protein